MVEHAGTMYTYKRNLGYLDGALYGLLTDTLKL